MGRTIKAGGALKVSWVIWCVFTSIVVNIRWQHRIVIFEADRFPAASHCGCAWKPVSTAQIGDFLHWMHSNRIKSKAPSRLIVHTRRLPSGDQAGSSRSQPMDTRQVLRSTSQVINV